MEKFPMLDKDKVDMKALNFVNIKCNIVNTFLNSALVVIECFFVQYFPHKTVQDFSYTPTFVGYRRGQQSED